MPERESLRGFRKPSTPAMKAIRLRIAVFAIAVAASGVFGAAMTYRARAAATIPKHLTYQARVVTSAGAPVPDGTLSIRIALYDSASGGTCLYALRGTCGAPASFSATTTNGVFSILIGDTTQNALPDSIFDANAVYLGLTVAGDAEMTPRKRLTAAPYAFNADRLDNLDVSAVGGSSAFIPATDSSGNLTLTGQSLFSSGTQALPGYSFSDDPDTGIYQNVPDAIAFSAGNSTVMVITSDGTVTIYGGGGLVVNSGDISAPASVANIANTVSTTVNFAGAATSLNIGANTGTTTISNNLVVSDRLDMPAHAASVGLNLPTNGGAPGAVTGTAEGDIVWDSTGNGLYVYDGAAFTLIGSTPTINDAYNNASGTSEISLNSAQGPLTVSDAIGGTLAHLFEIRDRVGTDSYTQRYFTVSATSTQVLNGGSFIVGSTNTFVVNSSGNITRLNNVATNWPSAQGGNGTVLTNDGAGNFSWSAVSAGSGTLNEAYNNSTSTSEISLNPTRSTLTLADTVGGLNRNLFEVVDRLANDSYSQRYLTVSATSTQILNGGSLIVGSTNTLIVNSSGNFTRINGVAANWPSAQGANGTVLTNDGAGNFSWATPGTTTITLNDAYNASTSTAEIALNASDGPLTIADTIGGLNKNLLEVVDRLANDSYSQRFFTVSATQVQVTNGAGNTPSLSFLGDQDTGFSNPADNRIDIITAGGTKVIIEEDFTLIGAMGLIVNGGEIDVGSSAADLLNTTPTTVNFAGVATTLNIGATTGTTTIANNLVVNDRLDMPAHAAGVGLNVPTNAGAPGAVTGTAEGDIVWDSTNNALYVYDGAAFVGQGATSITMQQTYANSTSTSEISLNNARGALTVADTVGGLNRNLFEVVDRLANDSYSQRYLTVSATSTQTSGSLVVGSTNTFVVNSSGNITRLNNVATNWPSAQGANGTVLTNDGAGNFSWTTPGTATVTLNDAYNASTSTAEIALNAGDGPLTIADTVGGLNRNLFEVVDRLANDSYSQRYLTVSATSVNATYDNLASNTAFSLSSGAAFSGNLMALNGTGNFTGDIIEITSAGTAGRAVFIDVDAGNNDTTIFEVVSDETSVSGTAADTQKLALSAGGSVTGDGNLTMLGSATLGDSSGTDLFTFTTAATTGSLMRAQTSGSVTTGILLHLSSTNNALTTGAMQSSVLTSPNVSSAFTGNLHNFEADRTFGTAGTFGESGSIARIKRTLTSNSVSATVNASGDVVSVISDGTQTSGTLNITGNVLELQQNYAAATGAALNIVNAGTGADLALPSSAIIDIGNGGSLIFRDGTNTLCTISDDGTTGSLTCTGSLVASVNLNEAYNNSTSTSEISLNPTRSTLTLADTVGGLNRNLFEVIDRLANDSYSQRYLTVSATSTQILNGGSLIVGSTNTLIVNSSGNFTRINGVAANWPSAQGGNGTVLTNDGAGNFSWTTPTASTTLQQSYDNDADGGDATITTNSTDGDLIVAGDQDVRVTATGQYVFGNNTHTTADLMTVNGTALTTASLLRLNGGQMNMSSSGALVSATATAVAGLGFDRGLINLQANMASTVGTFSTNVGGMNIDLNDVMRAGNTHGVAGYNLNITANSFTNHTQYGYRAALMANSASPTDASWDALFFADTAETTSGNLIAVQNGLLITNSGNASGGLVNGISIGASAQPITTALNIASTGVTTDIRLQNGEVIHNDTDGTIVFTDGTNTLCTITDGGTTGSLACTGGITASVNLNEAYNNSTSTSEISLNNSDGPLTLADTVGGLNRNLFEVIDRLANDSYSQRYLTVSSTSTQLSGSLVVGSTNTLIVNSSGNFTRINGVAANWPSAQGANGTVLTNDGAGNFSWTTPSGSGTLNDAFNSSTSTTELWSNSTRGAFTIADTFLGSHNIFEIRNRLANDAYSTRYFTVSSTSTGIGVLSPTATLEIGHPDPTGGTVLRAQVSGSDIFTVDYQGTITGQRNLNISRTGEFGFDLDSFWPYPVIMASPTSSFVQELISATLGGSPRFHVEYTGATGILTDTPAAELDIRDALASPTSNILTIGNLNASSRYFTVSSTSTSIGTGAEFTVSATGTVKLTLPISSGDFAVCHSSNVTAPQTNQMLVDCANTPIADYMEMYPSAAGLEMGDLVMPGTEAVVSLRGNYVPKVVKTNRAYEGDMIGVISNPGEAGDFNSIGHEFDQAANPLPVALKGRVRVKVNLENGPIAIGDAITSSSIAGVGMKATKPGMIVGQALEAWNGSGPATVLVFMGNGFHSGLAITTDGLESIFDDSFVFKPSATASASATAASHALSFAGAAWDADASSEVTRRLMVRTELTDPSNYQLSFRNDDGNLLAALNQQGDLSIAGSLSVNGGFDYAEMFPAVPDLEPGDLVSVDPDNETGYGVKKSADAFDETLLGVISTKPGFLTGDRKAAGSEAVALAGRVPAKVNLEGGIINPGDPITSSSVPGEGMKATEPGRVVGIALERYDGTQAERLITVFVNPSWYNGPLPPSGASGSGSLLTLNDDAILDFKNATLSNVSALVSANGAWSISADGYLEATQVMADRANFEQVNLRVVDETARTAGMATVDAGYKAEMVQNAHVTPNSIIIVTFETNPGSNWWISEKVDGHFMVELAQPAPHDAKFSWWIVGIDGELAPQEAEDAPEVDEPPTESGTSTEPSGSEETPDEGGGEVDDSGSGTPETP